MPSDQQDQHAPPISAPQVPGAEPGQRRQEPVAEAGDGHAPPPVTPERPPARAYVVIFATVLALVAAGLGVGLGYAVFRPTAPTTTPTTTPASGPITSPDIAAIAAKVDPAVVDINTTLAYQTATGAGTGMVVTSSGEVFTNNHVIDGATSLRVTDVGNGRTYGATVVGYDASADVAVLQLTGASDLPTVSFARARATVGQSVVAVGNAGGKGGTPSAVSGTVTGLDQSVAAQDELSGTTEHLSGLIATDAPIQAGDSGGPLVTTASRVLGMNTAGSSHYDLAQGTTQGFAIPIGTVSAIATQIEHGVSSATVHIGPTAFLGVQATNAGTIGAVVVKVLPGTPAAGIGLEAGDTIVSLGGQEIRSPTTLSKVLQAEKPGVTLPISWQDRFGQSYSTSVTLTSGPPA